MRRGNRRAGDIAWVVPRGTRAREPQEMALGGRGQVQSRGGSAPRVDGARHGALLPESGATLRAMPAFPPGPPATAARPLACLRLLLALLPVLVSGSPRSASAEDRDPRPFEEQPHLGLAVRDGPEGTLVVGRVAPGPLFGDGDERTAAIRRDDNVVSVDGMAVDAAGFRGWLRTKRPGEKVKLVVRRSPEADPGKAIPTGGPGGEPTTFEVTLARRSEWAGTLGRAVGRKLVLDAPTEGAYEAEVLAGAGSLGARAGDDGVGGGLDALLARLEAVQLEALDVNSLPCVVNGFRRPLSLDALEGGIEQTVRTLASGDATKVLQAIKHLLALPPWHVRGTLGREERIAMLTALRGVLRVEEVAPRLKRLVRTQRDSVYPVGPHVAEHVRVLGDGWAQGAALALSGLLHDQAGNAVRAATVPHEEAGTPAAPPVAVPAPQFPPGAVEGEVLGVGVDDFGRPTVLGGKGPNRYDMARLGQVVDLGGDDVYHFRGDEPAPQTVIRDFAGNDLYESTSDFQGPGATVLGVAWLEDLAGDDVYRSSGQAGIAAGIGGFGVLIDHDGNDRYENTGTQAGWSMGVGFYGAGVLIDRAGNDHYRGEKLCQGVGGPLGLGLVLDVAGNDRYDADGPSFGSAYGTPGVFLGMSQGFGYGVRGYAAGGVGALYDLAGDDRYTAGEFSQGGAYFFALGVLHDGGGNDLYHGNRYGQAFAAHQALGVLVDDDGDDTYWSMTAASQSGAWDECATLLLDKAGNDTYQCEGLGQGSAAMQAIALLVDAGGRDRYVGRGDSVQGQGGNNAYHYDADKVFSFSALLDLGTADDHYSSGRRNGTTTRTGALHPSARGESTLYGLFLDR
jgi:hypothetical protein